MYVRHTQTLSKAAHRSQQHCRMDGICHHLTRVANNSTLRSEAKVTEPHHQAEPIAAWHAPTGAPWLAATMIIQTCTSNTIRCRETATLLCFKIMLSIASHWALRRSKQLKAHQHFGMSSCSSSAEERSMRISWTSRPSSKDVARARAAVRTAAGIVQCITVSS